MKNTTVPVPVSKDAAARSLGCDRRTLSRIIADSDISPSGVSPSGHPLYDIGILREALEEHRAPELPPMTAQEKINSLIAMLSFESLMLDALAESVPPEQMRNAYLVAMQQRRNKQEPQHLWTLYARSE